MSLHDQYARLTPFEIAFPDRTVLAALSDRVAHETGDRADDTLLEAFITTAAVGELVRRLQGPEVPPEASYPFAALLYQCVHFLRAGSPLYLVSTGAVRRLIRPDAAGELAPGQPSAVVQPPAPAGYVQLPQHLVWTVAGSSGRGTPESLDGIFWTVSGSGALNALSVTGLLPDRPGFGALPLPAAPLADAGAWLEARIRGSGDDFASRLPGGELDDLYSVEAAGEVLKLLARLFVFVQAEPGRLEEREPDPAGAPHPSALRYTRVSLDG
jgi:hypothetical protein